MIRDDNDDIVAKNTSSSFSAEMEFGDPVSGPGRSVMKIISFIEKPQIIKKILKYLDLWDNVFPLHQWETLGKRNHLAIHLLHLIFLEKSFMSRLKMSAGDISRIPVLRASFQIRNYTKIRVSRKDLVSSKIAG